MMWLLLSVIRLVWSPLMRRAKPDNLFYYLKKPWALWCSLKYLESSPLQHDIPGSNSSELVDVNLTPSDSSVVLGLWFSRRCVHKVLQDDLGRLWLVSWPHGFVLLWTLLQILVIEQLQWLYRWHRSWLACHLCFACAESPMTNIFWNRTPFVDALTEVLFYEWTQ